MKFDYKKYANEVSEKTAVNKSNIYFHKGTSNEKVFEELFQFYQQCLLNNSKYGIEPSRMIYHKSCTSNARAGKDNGFYIIMFNKGLIKHLQSMFSENPTLISNLENHENLIEFESKLDNPIHILMYQSAIHFTFYHELGHLIQKSDFLENWLEEQPQKDENFILRKHVLETDSDMFASLQIGSHILQYQKMIFGNKAKKNDVENLLIIFCCSIFLSILSFETNRVPLYFKETTHPHPLIRNLTVISLLIDYYQKCLKKEGYDFQIDESIVMNTTLDVGEQLSNTLFDSYRYNNFLNEFGNNKKEIRVYFELLKDKILKNASLAVNKRKKLIAEYRKNKTD